MEGGLPLAMGAKGAKSPFNRMAPRRVLARKAA
jgi:hypothetical protein